MFIDENDEILLVGKTGKISKKNINEIKIDGKLEVNKNKYYIYLNRWYRLPHVYDSMADAAVALFSFIKECNNRGIISNEKKIILFILQKKIQNGL